MNNETRQRIEEELHNWHDPNSEARKRYIAAMEKWVLDLKPLQQAVEDSVRLTAEDFATRINTIA